MTKQELKKAIENQNKKLIEQSREFEKMIERNNAQILKNIGKIELLNEQLENEQIESENNDNCATECEAENN